VVPESGVWGGILSGRRPQVTITDRWARVVLVALGSMAIATGCSSSLPDATAHPVDMRVGPVLLPPETVRETITVPVMGFVLDPPPAGFVPAISWERALELAGSEEDASNTEEIRSMLALFTNPGEVPVSNELIEEPAVTGPPLTVKIPAWLITIDGVCIPSYGPSRGERCATTEATVVINADTGEVILEYSFQ
jgi:hypothetical protein